MIRRFSSLYDVIFDASKAKSIPSHKAGTIRNIGFSEGYTEMGERRDKTLSVERESFARHLLALLEEHKTIDRGDFFKLLHVAFEKALGRHGDQDLIFYHIHNPDNYELMNFLRYFPQSKLMMIIREPLQSCESWLSWGDIQKKPYEEFVTQLIECLFKFDQIIFKKHDSRAVRLEDIKADPSNTIKSLCKWLEIEEEESLYNPTMQGLKWWGDPTSIRFGRTEPVIGFEEDLFDPATDPTKREVGHFFSDRDQLILGTLLYPLRVLFGYAERNDRNFMADLKTIKPMLDKPFYFEKKIIDDRLPMGLDLENNTHYRLLRAAMKDRWAVIDAQGSYTNMIQPLRLGRAE